MCALRFMPDHEDACAIFKAYLYELIGDEHAANFLLVPLIKYREDLPSLHNYNSRMKTSGSIHMTMEQAYAMGSSPCALACMSTLENCNFGWTAMNLADKLGYDIKEISAVLAKLCAVRLVSKNRNGVYENRTAGKVLIFPSGNFQEIRHYMKSVRETHAAMVAKMGRQTSFYSNSVIRGEVSDVRQYRIQLANVIANAASYSSANESNTTGLFAIQASIVKLADL